MEKKLIKFKISAPSRIVLSGEHLAAYENKYVVVAAINLRTKLEFNELQAEHNKIILNFDRVKLQKEISLEKIQDYFFNKDISEILLDPYRFIRYITYFITINNLWSTLEQKFSLQIFFYMLYLMTKDLENRSPFFVRVTTEIPLADGLGSSTSFAVCLAACFLHWNCLQRGEFHDEFNTEELERIRQYAESFEKTVQQYGFPAIDSKICVYGQIRLCVREDYRKFTHETINVRKEFNILLIGTTHMKKEERAEQMANVQVSHTHEFDLILNKLNDVTEKIYDKLKYFNNIDISYPPLNEIWKQLQEDIKQNQLLLTQYNLSVPNFKNILEIANLFEFNVKLTGFGGKFAYILLQPEDTYEQIVEIFPDVEFELKIASIDANGVRIEN